MQQCCHQIKVDWRMQQKKNQKKKERIGLVENQILIKE